MTALSAIKGFRDSIRWRIFSYYTILMAVAITLLVVVHVWSQRYTRLRMEETELQAQGVRMLPVLFPPRSGGPERAPEHHDVEVRTPDQESPRFQNAIETVKRSEHFLVAFNQFGEVFFQTGNAPPPSQWPRYSPTQKQFTTTRTANDLYLLVRTPPGERFLIGMSLSKLAEEEKKQLLQASLLGGGVLVIVSLIGFTLISLALRPIKNIGATAKRIANGDLSERIDLGAQQSELGELAKILNTTFARLQEALQRQLRFTADASHELRTPVAAILADSQFALKRPRPPERYVETIEVCHESAQHMKSLIERLGLLAKFDANDGLNELEPMDLAGLAGHAADMIGPLADEHDVEVETELTPVTITGDRLRLEQAVINLLNNAVWYNRPSGRVWLRTGRNENKAFLEVEDSGIGIPADKVNLVFERFFRVDPSRNHKTGGSGLGLAICRSVVEAHGGTLTVESEAGKGSRFRMEFPIN